MFLYDQYATWSQILVAKEKHYAMADKLKRTWLILVFFLLTDTKLVIGGLYLELGGGI
jgi:hypothetical protein